MNKLRVLVTGASGQLGQALQGSEAPFELIFLDRTQLDVCDVVHIQKVFLRYKPHIVVHAAAYTQVDLAEEREDQAFEVNEWGTASVAKLCAKKNIKMLYLSSDYVFDGKQAQPYSETATPAPLSTYAASKLAGEERVLKELNNRALILRTAWLFSEYGHNFVKTIAKKVIEQHELSIVDDQIGSPTYAVDLAQWIIQLIPLFWQGTVHGIYHAAASGQCSWYELAQAIATELKAQGKIATTAKIQPVSSQDYAAKACRPAYSALNNQKLTQVLEPPIPTWQDMLKRCLAHL